MMAPHYERQALIGIAIEQATQLHREPIDAIIVHSKVLEVRLGGHTLIGAYGYANAYDPGGSPTPGSGNWWVNFRQVASAKRSWWQRLLGR